MSQVLLYALAASIPLAAMALAAAWAVEALGAGQRLRLCAWTAALLLPALPVPAMLAIHALAIPSPFTALEPRPEPVVDLVVATATALPAPPKTPAASPGLPVTALLLGMAAAGAAVRLGQLAFGLARVARLKARSEPIADPELAAQLGPGVRLADTEAPVLAGLVRPSILLPLRLLEGLSPDQAVLVCAHERAHLAAGDHLSHVVEETMVRVFWFNPLMAATRERLAAAREEACDARALAGCDAKRRRAYAQTLIAALRLSGQAEMAAAFTGFRRRGAERRLHAILKPPGPGSRRALAVALAAGLGLAAAIGGVSLAVAAEPLPPQAPPPPETVAPAPPAPAARRHHVIIEDGQGPGGDGHVVAWDGEHWTERKLTSEERVRLRAELKRAHEQAAQAMAESHAAIADAHRQLAQAHLLAPEDHERIQRQIDEALKQAHVLGPEFQARLNRQLEAAVGQAYAMEHARRLVARNDGRVLMRCKLGADGKATDCEKAFPDGPRFEIFRGPGDPPPPPAPPAPPAGA